MFPSSEKVIPLKNKLLAEYRIVYHINEGYAIKRLVAFSGRYQLLFTRYQSKVQHKNLMQVDSIFPNLLADVALDVLLYKVNSFSEYIQREKSIIVISPKIDKSYFRHIFKSFIHCLLFSEIASAKNKYTGVLNKGKLYCLEHNKEKIFFDFLLQPKGLKELLLEKIKLQVNTRASAFVKGDVVLCLEVYME
jgi:hypothetical protein